MKLRGKAKQRARRKALGRPRPDGVTISYTAKSWEPLPPDTPDDVKRVWEILKPPGAPPVDYGPAVPHDSEEG